jgi:hypothetical protein
VGAGLAAGVCVLVAVLVWQRGGGSGAMPPQPPIAARTTLSPQSVLFGDTVTAVVEATIDRTRVDPDSVQMKTDFAPWKLVGKPARFRRDAKASTYLRTTFAIRCLDTSCLEAGNSAFVDFKPARVTYTLTTGPRKEGSTALNVPWPELVVDTRNVTNPGKRASATPWRADLLSLPAVTYRIDPVLLVVLLLAVAALLATAGCVLAYRLLRRGAPSLPRPVVTPSAPPPTPIEQAFVVLEDDGRMDGVADRRRALQLVAEMLFERGDVTLARAARALAWSEASPGVRETSGLAADARSALGGELDEVLA